MEDGRTPVSTREEGGGRREAGEGSSYAKEVGWLSSVCQACEGGGLAKQRLSSMRRRLAKQRQAMCNTMHVPSNARVCQKVIN